MGSITTPETTSATRSRPIPIRGQTQGKGIIATRPAQIPSDVPALGLLGRICFGYSSRLLFPHANPNDPSTLEDETRWRGGRFVNRVRNGNPAFVAVASNSDSNNDSLEGTREWTIAGAAQWKPPKKSEAEWKETIEGGLHGDWKIASGKEEGGEYQAGLSKEEEAREFPETMDIKKYDELMEIVQREEKKVLEGQGVDEGDVWYLQTLATHPDYTRRGIGKALLRWGIEQAQKDKTHVFLTATAEGRFLYKSQGFVELAEYEIGGEPHYGMMWFYRPEDDPETGSCCSRG